MTKTPLSASRAAGGGSKHPAHLYDTLWDEAGLVDYKIWPIWEQVMRHGPAQGRRLEIGCGIAPKIPAAGSYFIDLSPPCRN